MAISDFRFITAFVLCALVIRSQADEKLDNFLVWLNVNGVELSDSVEIGSFFAGYGYSARAKYAIQEGTVLFKVPQSVIFNTKNALNYTPEIYQIFAKENITSNLIILSLLLLHNKNLANSFWKPYIDILPEKLDSLPYWSEIELAELKGSPVYDRANSIIQSRKEAFSTYSKIFTKYPLLFPPDKYNQETFDWSIGILRSRSFGIPLNNEGNKEEEDALIPLADLLNHKFESSSWNFNENLTMTMKTRLSYMKGDQVFNTYGMKTNAQLLLYYGFLVENNTFDTFHFTWKSSFANHVPFWKEKLLKKFNLATESEFVITHSSLLSKDILLYVKIMLLEEELDISTHLLTKQDCKFELQILRVVEDKLNGILSKYSNMKQSLERDSSRKILAAKLKEGEVLLVKKAILSLDELKNSLECYSAYTQSSLVYYIAICATLLCILLSVMLKSK